MIERDDPHAGLGLRRIVTFGGRVDDHDRLR
jgi:hypothetical protein